MALESFLTNGLTPALAQEADEFLDSQDTAHPFQFPQWADPESRLILLREGGKIRWLGTFSVYSPLGWKVPWIRAAAANRGPVSDDRELWEAAADELAKSMRKEGLAYLEVSPDWIQPADGESPGFLNNAEWRCSAPQRATLRLSLSASADEIFANFSKNTRYEVRRAERLGAMVTVASSDAEIEEFSRLYQALAARKGFSPDSIERLRRQIRWLMDAPSRGALLLARTDNVVRGGTVVGRAGRRCWYIWGASDKQEHVNVGHILQWHALQWAKSNGCSEYDFGGYTPGATSGPAWFKAGFGGTVVHFVAPHRRVIRTGAYRVFSLLSRIR
jgi:peptidoglycan pentaglycine glycine transferase (the first glycine)